MSEIHNKNYGHEDYMSLALSHAEKAYGMTQPNPMVGAVIVKDEKILSIGYHRRAGEAHAEVNAIAGATESVEGSTMYVSLEPCCHYGKTPPCTKAIIDSKIRKVYVAMTDPNPVVAGKGIDILREHGVEVEVGLLNGRARKLNEVFINRFESQKPFVTAKVAQTLDGRIADLNGDSKWITNEYSREYVHKIRSLHDGILVGIGTVIADDPSLTSRIDGGRDPWRLVLDSNLRVSLDSKLVVNNQDRKTVIVTSENSSNAKASELESLGVRVWTVGVNNNSKLDLNEVMERSFEFGIKSILIEGGAGIFSSAFDAGVVDKIECFIAPKILGGGKNSVVGCASGKISETLDLKDTRVRTFDSDVLISGYVG